MDWPAPGAVLAERLAVAPEWASIGAAALIGALLLAGPLALANRALLRAFGAKRLIHGSIERSVRMGLRIGIAAAIAAAAALFGGAAALGAALIATALLLAICDARWRWLPVEWTGALLASGLLLTAAAGAGADALAASMAVAALLMAVRAGYAKARGVEGLGLGDVLLMAAVAAYLGLAAAFALLFVASCLALIAVAICSICTTKPDIRPVPLGAYLALSFAIVPTLSLLL